MGNLAQLEEQIRTIENEIDSEIDQINSLDDCEAVRVAYLGRKGKVTTLFQSMKDLDNDEKPKAGQLLNSLRGQIESKLEGKTATLSQSAIEDRLESEQLDITLSGRPPRLGNLHIITQTLREIYEILKLMGFQVYQTPEVEHDEMNFQLLNFPPDHPARDMQSTFLTKEPNILLRTHTSPGQIRVMRSHCPEPVRAILPGKCYRYEQITTRSEIQFDQVEGIAIGEHITLADLKGVLTEFSRQMFGEGVDVKMRGSYFPFTEPSVELDVTCILCDGNDPSGCAEKWRIRPVHSLGIRVRNGTGTNGDAEVSDR